MTFLANPDHAYRGVQAWSEKYVVAGVHENVTDELPYWFVQAESFYGIRFFYLDNDLGFGHHCFDTEEEADYFADRVTRCGTITPSLWGYVDSGQRQPPRVPYDFPHFPHFYPL